MVRFIAQKHLGSLRPVDEMGQDILRKVGNGKLVVVEIKRSRNIFHHRLFWALMSKVWENLDHERYPSIEDFVGAVKICLGIRTRIELHDGTVGFIPGSISFSKMDQSAFDEFYNRVCDLLSEHFLPGVTSEELKQEIEQMIGGSNG